MGIPHLSYLEFLFHGRRGSFLRNPSSSLSAVHSAGDAISPVTPRRTRITYNPLFMLCDLGLALFSLFPGLPAWRDAGGTLRGGGAAIFRAAWVVGWTTIAGQCGRFRLSATERRVGVGGQCAGLFGRGGLAGGVVCLTGKQLLLLEEN